MKSRLLFILFLFSFLNLSAVDYSGYFVVGGSSSGYYPVLFSVSGIAPQSSLGKLNVYIPNVHTNGWFSGTFHSEIEFVSSNWGHIDTKIVNFTYVIGDGSVFNDPIGDIQDGSGQGSNSQLVIWLKGGATYYWSSTNNSKVILTDGNSAGVAKTSDSGQPLAILNSQSSLILKAKNNIYHEDVGIATERNIYAGGNIGIGTTSPFGKIDVKTSQNQHIQFVKDLNGHLSGCVGITSINDDNTNYTPLGFLSSKYTFLFGNVGIGTTNPDELLTVNGAIHAKEIKVDLTGSLADFVFSPDYKLKSLTELEQYLKENRHLPEIPSATEVKENGLSLGEMQNKLLQKIEELTLYVIEQDKSKKELEKKYNELLNKLESVKLSLRNN